MKIADLKLVNLNHREYEIGRCVHCDARDFCGLTSRFDCKASMSQHYINIKEQRKLKLQKIYENR